jgi:hypothetical protein
MKLGKSAIETLEMLRAAFEEYSLSRTAAFDWPVECQLKMTNVQGDENQPNDRKC